VDAVLESAGLAAAGLAAGLAAATLTVFAGGLLGSGSSRGSIFRRDDVRLDAVLLLSDVLLLFSFTIAAQNLKNRLKTQNIGNHRRPAFCFVYALRSTNFVGDKIHTSKLKQR
jgi:hypothetical protein